ncbi:MAG TPA: DUF4158 domain-containing protein, partial [Nakamurella sp.]|nr:DUF4158 domain-containing protein [Nakamurella sp.]
MGREPVDLGELVEHWTLLEDERGLIAGKRGATRLGFALLLKFYTREGRFPRGRSELPDDAVDFVGRQVKVPAADLGLYEWAGRTIESHRSQIRQHLGFRECTVADAEVLTSWLAADVCTRERRPDQVREELLGWCRAEQIEPPSAGRIERIVRSALHSGELALVLRISARLAPATVQRISALIDDGEHGEGDTSDDEPPMLAMIKEAPGNVSLETLLAEIGRLLRVRAIDLPADLFDDVAPKVVAGWRARAAVESPSHLRDNPEPLRLTLLAALLHAREREITDTLVDLLIATVHRIGARAEKRVTQELVNAFRRVTGKENILFRVAEAALAAPEGTVREVVFPAVAGGEQTLRELVHEFKTQGPIYRRTVQTTLKASYTNHYRRGLIRLLDVLEFRSSNTAHRPVVEALALIARHAATGHTVYYPWGETVPAHRSVDGDWEDVVYRVDTRGRRRVVRMAYEVATFQSLREALRCKEIWVTGADRWRNPDQDLPADFEEHRTDHYRELRKPLDPADFIAETREQMRTELTALNDALPALEWLTITERRAGAIKLTAAPASARAAEPAPDQDRGAAPLGHGAVGGHAEGSGVAYRLPGHRDRRRRRQHPRRDPRRASAAGDLRLRHQHRHQGRRLRWARTQRRRHPLRPPPVPDPGDGPHDRGPDRRRHVRRPPYRPVGHRVDRGRLGLHPRAGLRPEPVHRVA